MGYRVGLDIGGTTIGIGFIDENDNIEFQTSILTRTDEKRLDPDKLAKRICESILEFDKKVDAIGIGVPGTVDSKSGTIIYANNLDFVNVPFASYIKRYIDVPVEMDNDANVAAWAEYKAGACKDKNINSMVMITLGTGVGAGYVFNNQIFSGCNMGAGEIGHMVIDMYGKPCNCGRRGCFEGYASATALMEAAAKAMEKDGSTVLWELCPDRKINGKIFFEAVRRKDELANRVYDQYMTYLSVGVLNVINALQPDMLVIGGGISQVGDLLLNPLKARIKDLVYTRDSKIQTQIVIAKLGNEAGILGGGLLNGTAL